MEGINSGKSKLTIVPCYLKEANKVVAELHRHHQPVKFHIFSMGVIDETGKLRGVAIVARPANRYLVDGFTLEVCRVAVDGCPNACSALYGNAAKVAKALGYKTLITYTLPEESGSSLRGAGWRLDPGEYGGRSWSSTKRQRIDKHPVGPKLRWRKLL